MTKAQPTDKSILFRLRLRMGRGDNRLTAKMKRRRSQEKFKARQSRPKEVIKPVKKAAKPAAPKAKTREKVVAKAAE